MNKSFWAILIGVVVGLLAVFLLLGGKEDVPEVTFDGDPLVVQESDFVRGEGGAGVEIIEFGDFECPACGAFFPLLLQLEAEFAADISLAFRHFPLTNIHPNAFAAHRAAEAAGNQDMFWQMHDLLYSRQQTWSAAAGVTVGQAADIFEGFANDLGLNMEQFTADVAAQETFDAINRHIEGGTRVGVDSTPTIYLNGEEIPTIRSYDELKALVEEEIANSQNSTDEEN